MGRVHMRAKTAHPVTYRDCFNVERPMLFDNNPGIAEMCDGFVGVSNNRLVAGYLAQFWGMRPEYFGGTVDTLKKA